MNVGSPSRARATPDIVNGQAGVKHGQEQAEMEARGRHARVAEPYWWLLAVGPLAYILLYLIGLFRFWWLGSILWFACIALKVVLRRGKADRHAAEVGQR